MERKLYRHKGFGVTHAATARCNGNRLELEITAVAVAVSPATGNAFDFRKS